jgi:two-component system chemotaxis response regulator CheY
MLMSLTRILKGAGFEVETAANGKLGLEKLARGLQPGIILTDLNMPEMDGIEFIKGARKTAATRFTPIVVLTTESSAKGRDSARAAGATGWLSKPTEPKELLSTIMQLLPSHG